MLHVNRSILLRMTWFLAANLLAIAAVCTVLLWLLLRVIVVLVEGSRDGRSKEPQGERPELDLVFDLLK